MFLLKCGSEVNKRIRLFSKTVTSSPHGKSLICFLPPPSYSFWLLLQETMDSPWACQASPVIQNESQASLNTAVIQFPWGPGATRPRQTWAGWECWAGGFLSDLHVYNFRVLNSPRSERKQKRLRVSVWAANVMPKGVAEAVHSIKCRRTKH